MSVNKKRKEIKSNILDILDFESITKETDSPIEEIFNAALLECRISDLINDPMKNYSLMIDTQVEVSMNGKKYIPDFRIMLFQHFDVAGESRVRGFACYVECDGHDFHERTKKQAENDRKKDRAFIDNGETLFRFTGSEIYNSSFKCAKEVIDFLYKKVSELNFKIM